MEQNLNGEQLHRIRKALNMKPEPFGKLIGCHRTLVGKYEKGKRRIPGSTQSYIVPVLKSRISAQVRELMHCHQILLSLEDF